MSYLPFDTDLKPARRKLPKGTCDTHFHFFQEFERFPLSPAAQYVPSAATVEDYKRMCNAYGIERAVLIHPSVYGADHSSYEVFMAENRDWLRGVAVIPADIDSASIERWNALGTKGTRINRAFPNGPSDKDVDTIIQKVKPFGWHIQIFVNLIQDAALLNHITGQGVPVVVDHIGLAGAEALLPSAGLKNLLSLMKEGSAWVKLSAPYRSSTQQPRYPDLRPLIDKIIQANDSQIVWGTDWPHPHISAMPNDGDLVDLVYDWFPDEALLKKVLVDNPTRLYWTE